YHTTPPLGASPALSPPFGSSSLLSGDLTITDDSLPLRFEQELKSDPPSRDVDAVMNSKREQTWIRLWRSMLVMVDVNLVGGLRVKTDS
ncbi:hypothetical protein D0Y65_049067, partial [Glycine soja]